MSICEYLKDKTILITGATGFLGKPLVEKILREVPGIRQIYLLIRPKRKPSGEVITAEQRMKAEIFQSDVFDRLREEKEDFEGFMDARMTAVGGDVSVSGLNMAPEDYARLQTEIDIIINSAAVVVFDERLDFSVQLNTLGPKRLLDFAQECPESPLFVHVSTAYVNGQRLGQVPEKLFRPNESIARELRGGQAPAFSIEDEIEYAIEQGRRIEEEARDPGMFRKFFLDARGEVASRFGPLSKKFRNQILSERNKYIRGRLVEIGMARSRQHGWHDTYTFTKAMGEQLLIRDHGELPVAIIRPSIIESAYQEPRPGWIDGFRMADPLIAAYGKGRLKDFIGDPDCVMDLIPVDHVVNALLAAIPYTAEKKGVQLFQIATGSQNPVKLREVVNYVVEHFTHSPMKDKRGAPIKIAPWTFPGRKKFERQNWLRYQLPLSLVQKVGKWLPGMSRHRSRASIILNAIERVSYYADIYGPYVEHGCEFGTDNTCRLQQSLTPEEQARFPFDVHSIDWRRYICEIHIPGLKRHVLKMETVDEEEPRDIHAGGPEEADGNQLQAGIETIQDLYVHGAVRFGTKTALQLKRGGEWQRISFGQLRVLAAQVRTSLFGAGLRPGDRVLLLSENQPEWGVAYLGAISLGLSVVPLDRQTRSDEVRRVAEFVETSHLMTSPVDLDILRSGAGDGLEGLRLLNITNYGLDFGEPPQSEPPYPEDEIVPRHRVNPDDVASIIFTSGTTVEPKGVMLTHGNFIANVRDIAAVLAPYETDEFLSVLPLHHAFEFTCGFLMPIFGGACVTYASALKSKVLLDTMQETGTTALLGVPRLFKLFYDGITSQIDQAGALVAGTAGAFKKVSKTSKALIGYNAGKKLFKKVHDRFGGRVRVFVSGGAALDPQIFENFMHMGFPVCEGFGLTETSPVLTVNPLEEPKSGSVGPPLPSVDLRIENPDANGVGEIVVRGPSVMKGYFKNEEATRRVLISGWFHTGDLGKLDADGYLYITGRVKDLIVTAAGKNVYPDEVEMIYRDLPHVKELTVLGIRAPGSLGEEVHLVLVLDASGTPAAAKSDVQAEIRKRSAEIPTYQRVQKVHFWDQELPKTPTLKVRRNVVRQMLLGEETEPVVEAKEPGAGPGSFESREEEFIQLLSELTRVPAGQIRPDSDLQYDLSMDSLLKVELGVVIENKYGIRVPEGDLNRLHQVQDAMGLIEASAAPVAGASPDAEIAEPAVDWSSILKGGELSPEDLAAIDKGHKPDGMSWVLFHKMVRAFAGTYFNLEARGLENIPGEGAFVIAANHSSHLDSVAVMCALEDHAPRIRILGARDYFFDRRIKGWFFRHFMNVLPFDREENFLEGLRIARACIEKGYSLLIFPEGTRSTSGETQAFKVGVGIIAYELGVPIVPARVSGTFQALPKGSSLPRRHPVAITFGLPVGMDEFDRPEDGVSRFPLYRQIVDRVRERILEL